MFVFEQFIFYFPEFHLIADITMITSYKLNWKKPDIDGVLDFLCNEHDFSRNRVQKALEKMTIGYTEVEKKTTLEKWFT